MGFVHAKQTSNSVSLFYLINSHLVGAFSPVLALGWSRWSMRVDGGPVMETDGS